MASEEAEKSIPDTLITPSETHLPFLGVPLCGPMDAFVDSLEAMGYQRTEDSPYPDEVWLQGMILGHQAAVVAKGRGDEVCMGMIGIEGDSLDLAATLDRFHEALYECYAPHFNAVDTIDSHGRPLTRYQFYLHNAPVGHITSQIQPPPEHGHPAMLKIVFVDKGS